MMTQLFWPKRYRKLSFAFSHGSKTTSSFDDDKIERDVSDALAHHHDGYGMAKYLENSAGWSDVNGNLVHVLHGSRHMLDAVLARATRAWVTATILTLRQFTTPIRRGSSVDLVRLGTGDNVGRRKPTARTFVSRPEVWHTAPGTGTSACEMCYESSRIPRHTQAGHHHLPTRGYD